MRGRRTVGWLVGFLVVLLAGAAAMFGGHLDLERFRGDAGRLRKLREAPLLNLAGPSPGADWPQWRGPNRDGLSPEVGLLRQWPASGPRLLWQVVLHVTFVVSGVLFALMDWVHSLHKEKAAALEMHRS